MSVDTKTVRKIARLARIGIGEAELEPMAKELNTILHFVEQLDAIDTSDVAPMTSAVETKLPQRADEVTDGECADDIVKNAPERIDTFFAVPKVVE